MTSEIDRDGWVRVKWDNGTSNSYRMGKDSKYDLSLAASEVPKKEDMQETQSLEDSCITEGIRHLP